MRTIATAVLVVCLCASWAAAETATIENTDKGVSISISGPKRRAPAKVEPAGEAQGAGQAEAVKKEIFPAKLYEKLSPAQKERADAIIEILKKYSSRNTYSELSETQCKQMSEAIWFRLAGKGIPARLAAGRVDAQVTTAVDIFVRKANHAWVMAELSPGEWVALETTNGTVVPKDVNQLYYMGGGVFPAARGRLPLRRRAPQAAAIRQSSTTPTRRAMTATPRDRPSRWAPRSTRRCSGAGRNWRRCARRWRSSTTPWKA